MRVLVIGGGIGGLAAGIALRRAGIDIQVFERASELRELGAGISLWANALRAADRLGVAEAVRAADGELFAGEVRSWKGRLLFRIPVAEISRQVGSSSVCMTRAALQAILYEALPAGAVRLGARCTGFDVDASGVTARFADGTTERGDVPIGADGIHSVVRERLFGPSEPRHTGHAGYRAVTAFRQSAVGPVHAFEAWGPGASFGMIPMDNDQVYWFAARKAPRGERDDCPKEVLTALFGRWCDPIPELIAATPESDIAQLDIVDRPPSRVWGKGRTALLGDAVHPMTPNLGQGGCLAFEDAVVLARCLRMDADCARALRTYENARRPRCTRIAIESWRFGRMSLLESPVLCAIRNACIRMAPSWRLNHRYRKMVGYEAH